MSTRLQCDHCNSISPPSLHLSMNDGHPRSLSMFDALSADLNADFCDLHCLAEWAKARRPK